MKWIANFNNFQINPFDIDFFSIFNFVYQYLGCFRSWDLPVVKKRVETTAVASFSNVVVHAVKDAKQDKSERQEDETEEQYFFAIARHDAPHKVQYNSFIQNTKQF